MCKVEGVKLYWKWTGKFVNQCNWFLVKFDMKK